MGRAGRSVSRLAQSGGLTRMSGNLRSRLPRRTRAGTSLRDYDRLPPDLRAWMQQAALPWSAASVLRLWQRALRQARGNSVAARARLDLAEQRCLARDSSAPDPIGKSHLS